MIQNLEHRAPGELEGCREELVLSQLRPGGWALRSQGRAFPETQLCRGRMRGRARTGGPWAIAGS